MSCTVRLRRKQSNMVSYTNLQGFLHTMKRISTTTQKALIVHPMMMPSLTLNSGLSFTSDFVGFSRDVLTSGVRKKTVTFT